MSQRQPETAVHPQAVLKKFNRAIETGIDPLGIASPLLHAQLAWLSHPQELAEALSQLSVKMWRLGTHAALRAVGQPSQDVERPHPDDMRFADPVWTDSATWDIVKESYLALTHHVQDMLFNTPGLSGKERRRAAFWWRKYLNAMAPTNFLMTNPVAFRKAIETNGASLRRGAELFMADLRAGDVRMTGPGDFRVGENLATTPGDVVFRNRLLEVIRYRPTAAQVHATPVVIVTPWINKFYVLDLTPKKSMVRFLVEQGFDVFITSWKNPPAAMRDVSFDDYLTEGISGIVQVARDITGADRVHGVGYCIGGAALTTWLAWAHRRYGRDHVPMVSLTLFATLLDYHKPGDIEVFLDEASVRWLSASMERKGFLDGREMATAFRLLRSNSLIWHYVVHGYLYGEAPPPLDVLFWNMDTTRMPAAMHAWYLREFYLENNLIRKDAVTVAGERIDLGCIDQPCYIVSAQDDHIAPWRQTFRACNFLSGSTRFVLSSSGHILGVVNPVVHPPKRDYRVAFAARHDTDETWQARAEFHRGSWWEDWMAWLKPLSGALRTPDTHPDAYPSLGPAPGSYVLER